MEIPGRNLWDHPVCAGRSFCLMPCRVRTAGQNRLHCVLGRLSAHCLPAALLRRSAPRRDVISNLRLTFSAHDSP